MPPPEQHPGIDQTRTDRCRQVNIVPCTLLSCGALWTDYVPMHGNLGCLHFRQCILPAAFLSVLCHRLEPVGKLIMAHCKASVAAPSASHAAFSTSTGAATWFALAPLVALAQLWGVVLLQFTLPETRLRQWDRDNGSAAATSGNSFIIYSPRVRHATTQQRTSVYVRAAHSCYHNETAPSVAHAACVA